MSVAEPGIAADGAIQGAPPARVRDYFDLMKPRVMSLVIFTGLVGLLMAPGALSGAVHPMTALVAVLCIAVGAGASGALNQWFDADIDAVMARTAGRPIPAGRIAREDAAAFGIVLSALSVMVMGLFVNWLAAGLLALTIGFYLFVYTMWLKRLTPQNIVIGGAAGALPPVIGWAAVTGDVALAPLMLFALIFMWTPPHFWALALWRSGDYARAGVPMLPNVAGERATRVQILLYALNLVPLGAAPSLLGAAGWPALIAGIVFGLVFAGYALRVLRAPAGDMETPKRLFAVSILYLFALFAVYGLEPLLGIPPLAPLL